jgi:lipoate-protein ligase A
VLNLSEPVTCIEKYLRHPVREPDYREKRAHRDFVTSLSQEDYSLDPEQIKSAIQKQFSLQQS